MEPTASLPAPNGHEARAPQEQGSEDVSNELVEVLREISAAADSTDAHDKLLKSLLYAAIGAGGSVASSDTKMLMKKVHSRLSRKLRSKSLGASRHFQEVCTNMMSEAESVKEAPGWSTLMRANAASDSTQTSLAKCFVNLLEAEDLQLTSSHVSQLLSGIKDPQQAQPFLLAAMQEQSRKCVAEVVDAQRPVMQSGLQSGSASALPKLGGLENGSALREVTQRCRAACQSPEAAKVLQHLLRQNVQHICRSIKEARAPPAKSSGSELVQRLQSSKALRELETDLDKLQVGIQSARESMTASRRGSHSKEAKKSSRSKAGSSKAAAPAERANGTAKEAGFSDVPAAAEKATAERANGAAKAAIESGKPAKTVVINCANVGTVYSESRRQLYAGQLQQSSDAGSSGSAVKKGFDWDGVRRAFDFYESHGITPQGVCKNRTAVVSPVPSDLKPRVIVCPIVDDQRDADDLFTIRLAMRYGCQLVDNDNYRDWKHEEGKWGTNDDIRDWLQGDGAQLKVTYVFDRTGRFVPSVPPQRTT